MSTHTIELPYLTPPLSLNDRMHRQAKARITRRVRLEVALLARSARLPRGAGHVTVTLHYAPRDDRRRDTDNLVATSKPCFDGLVDAGLVPDDTPQWMSKPEPVIHPKTGTGRGKLWLDIEVEPAQ